MDHDRLARKTVRAAEVLEKLSRRDCKSERKRYTVDIERIECHRVSIALLDRVRALRLMQHSPRGVAPRSDDAEGISFAEFMSAGRTPLYPLS